VRGIAADSVKVQVYTAFQVFVQSLLLIHFVQKILNISSGFEFRLHFRFSFNL
jgi:hypothetical protein